MAQSSVFLENAIHPTRVFVMRIIIVGHQRPPSVSCATDDLTRHPSTWDWRWARGVDTLMVEGDERHATWQMLC